MSNTWNSGDGHRENEQQPPQPDWARWEAEHGFANFDAPPAPPARRPAPVDVETARHLWWGVTALGMLGLLLTLFVVNGERTVFAEQLVDDVKAQDPTIPLTVESAESYLTVALVVMALLGAGIAALVLRVVAKMRLGRMWARAVLTMIGTIVVVMALPQLFGFGVDGGAVQIVSGVTGIAQGVLAAGAIYLMHRKESNAYFLGSRAS